MDKGSCNGDHLPMNQSLPKIAPYPTEPAASEEIGNGSPTRRQQKTVPIPWLEEFKPLRQIQVKFSIRPYRMVISAKGWQQIDHAAEEGATQRDDFARMLKIAN